VSETFTVAIGPTVAMHVLTQPDHAYGGSPFYEQPVVALTVRMLSIITAICLMLMWMCDRMRLATSTLLTTTASSPSASWTTPVMAC
jgi:hypothetical protein